MSSWWLASWRGKPQKSCIEASQNPLPPLIPQKQNLEKDDMQDNTGVLSSALNFDFDPLRLEYEDPSNLAVFFFDILVFLDSSSCFLKIFRHGVFSMFSKIAPPKKRIIGCLQTFFAISRVYQVVGLCKPMGVWVIWGNSMEFPLFSITSTCFQ